MPHEHHGPTAGAPHLGAPQEVDLYGEFDALCQLVRLGQGRFTLALIEFDLPRLCAKVISDMQEQFSALNIVEAELAPPPPDAPLGYNVLDQLKNVVQTTSPDQPPDLLILTGLEILFPPSASTDHGHMNDELRRALQPLNLGRNILADMFPCPLLLFLPKAAMEILLTSAPDIVSWKSGFFVFESELDEVRAELYREAGVRIGWLERWRLRRIAFDELMRERKRLADLTADARMQPAEKPIVARLQNRLGWIAVVLGDGTLAQRSFAEMLRVARDANDPKLIKMSEKGLRQAEKLRRQGRNLPKRSVISKQSFLGAASLSKADGLFGRETEQEELLLQVNRVGNRFTTVWGETGCGKTSLVMAGVLPRLEKQGNLSAVVREWEHPASAVRDAVHRACGLSRSSSDSLRDWLQTAAQKTDKPVIFVFDQFEQLFTKHPQRQERESLLNEIGACLNDFRLPCRFVFILREDFLGRMVELERFVGDALDRNKRFYLSLFDRATARRVLRQLSDKAKLNWPDVFLNEIIKDLNKDGQVRPIELQLVGAALTTLEINDEQAYSRAGRAEGLLTDYLQVTLESVSNNQRELQSMKRVLLALIEEPQERLLLTAEEISFRSETTLSSARDKLNKLINVNLVNRHPELAADKAEDGAPAFLFELIHDVLVDSVLRLTRDVQDKRRQAKRILTRAVEDLRLKPHHTISLREERLLRKHLPAQVKEEPKAKALLRRSLLFGLVKWVIIGLLAPLAVLSFVQNTFTHVTTEQDFNDRIVIRRGLPELGFLPLIGNSILIDTGFTTSDLNRQQRGDVQGLTNWAIDSRSATSINTTRFYKSFSSVERGKLLVHIGYRNEGISEIVAILNSNNANHIRGNAVASLVELVKADPSIAKSAIRPLLTVLKEDSDYYVRLTAAQALPVAIKADPSLAKTTFTEMLPVFVEEKERGDHTYTGSYNYESFHEALAIAMAIVVEADNSLAKPAVEYLSFALFENFLSPDASYRARDILVRTLAKVIQADRSLGIPIFDVLFRRIEDVTLRKGEGKISEAIIKGDKGYIEPILNYLHASGKTEYYTRAAIVKIMTLAMIFDKSVTQATLNTLISVETNSFPSAELLLALETAVKADRSVAKSVFEYIHANFEKSIAEFRKNQGISTFYFYYGLRMSEILETIIQADNSFAEPAFNLLIIALKDSNDSGAQLGAAQTLVVAMKAKPSLAKLAFEKMIALLQDTKDSDRRRAATLVLAGAVEADTALAKPAVEKMIALLQSNTDNDIVYGVTIALGNSIANSREAVRNVFQLFTDDNPNIREAVIDGFARYLAMLASEETKTGRDPAEFLLGHLGGQLSLMPNGNAETHAVYRQSVVRAIAWWMASKKPEDSTTQDVLKQQLEKMRDQETRLHIRIAAWNALSAAADLLDKNQRSL